MEQVEAERDGVLEAICRVKEQLQSVTDEMCQVGPEANSDQDCSHDVSSGGSSSGSGSSRRSTGSFFGDIQSDIRHKESEIQSLRWVVESSPLLLSLSFSHPFCVLCHHSSDCKQARLRRVYHRFEKLLQHAKSRSVLLCNIIIILLHLRISLFI